MLCLWKLLTIHSEFGYLLRLAKAFY